MNVSHCKYYHTLHMCLVSEHIHQHTLFNCTLYVDLNSIWQVEMRENSVMVQAKQQRLRFFSIIQLSIHCAMYISTTPIPYCCYLCCRAVSNLQACMLSVGFCFSKCKAKKALFERNENTRIFRETPLLNNFQHLDEHLYQL